MSNDPSNIAVMPAAQPAVSRLGKTRSIALGILFLCSGAAALIYEVVWTRQLMTLFGATVYAVATVLTSFMGGLALGSWLLGRRADRLRHPWRAFAGLELGIALAALAFPHLLRMAGPLIGALYASGGEPRFVLFSLVRFVIAFVLLLVPTTLMGATLPVISRAVTDELGAAGRTVGRLYAVNTAGAVLGVFISGFFLIERLGIQGTTFLAVGLDLLVAVLAAAIGWRLPPLSPPEDAPRPAEPAATAYPRTVTNMVLFSYCLSGLVALAYQVAWTRALIFSFETLKATTYSFAGMLTVFLLGLAIGSAVMQGAVARIRDPLFAYGLLLFLIGSSGAVSIYLINGDLPSFLALAEFDPSRPGELLWWPAVVNVMSKAALSFAVPTLCMGMAFPVVVRIVAGGLNRLGRDVGEVYALNTLGAILGSFLGGFVLIPAVGLTMTIGALSALSLLMATLVFAINPQLTRQQRPAVAGVFVLVAAVFVGSILWQARALKYQQLTLGEKLVFYKEGALATVSVKEDSKGWRTIYVDDVGVAGTDPVLQTDQKTLAHVPMILLGGKAERTLTVGFGSGGASWSYTLYPDIKEIDAIEITTTVPEAAPSLTDANHGIVFPRRVIEEARKTMAPGDHLPGAVHPLGDYTVAANRQFMTFDPRYRIIVDDARSYLRFTSRVYDVIATDCTDLRYKTNANLYDREYFNLCRDRISDRGLVVVWTPLAGLSDEAFRIVVRTFREVFPDMTVWYFTNQPTHYCLFIGQKGGVKINYGDVLHALELPAIQKDLEEIGLRDPAKLVASFVTDQRGIDAYVGTGPLNTEDFPIIEFLSPRYGYDSTPVAINMGRLYDVQVPVWDLVVDRTEESLRGQPRIADIQQANDILFQGHVQYREHNFLDACKLYEKARKIAPHDKSIDDLLEFEELRLLLEWELKRTVTVTDAQWTNAQWIAWQLGSIFEFQKRYPDAVSTVMPFANRVPPPETGDLPDDLRQSGYALNVLLARCYAAVKNETRAREFFNTAKAYEPNRPDWPKIEDEVFGVP